MTDPGDQVLARTVPDVGGSARRLTVAAGLFGLAAVLKLVFMLTGTTQDTTADWLTLALFGAASPVMAANVVSLRRARPPESDEDRQR